MTRNIRYLIIALIAAMVLSGCSTEQEGIVAKVDGHEITQEEFDKDFQVYKDLYERQLGEGALDQEGIDGKTMGESLKESILEKLIMERLIQDDNERKGIEVTEEDLQKYIDEYKESIGGEESYQQFLQSNSLSEEYFVDNMGKELRGRKHKEDFLSGISISEEQAREYYEENKDNLIEISASHILLGSEAEALSLAERLDAGEDFAQLATTQSLDSVSAVNGGNLGYFGKGQMIPEFEEVAFQLEEGQISNVVKTEVGYHIIKVQDKRESFDDLEEKVNSLIKEQEYFEYVQSLRDDATISTYLD
ncbi:peptidylprolyl isomerase [Gudongella sp. SC589]|jgi:parvulin-like peptidyl-prolyl isomerase|uniref:peptidylprolyl isomerase n=1 Tax=Gudongella sp. SC589 TaxID=3385990 RepID=UPI0039046D04